MGFDEFTENEDKYRRHNGDRYSRSYTRYPYDQHDNSEYHISNNGHMRHNKWLILLEKVRSNGKLRALIVVGAVIVLITCIFLIIALLPLIVKLIKTISESGIQGLVESVTGFLEKLWKGTAN